MIANDKEFRHTADLLSQLYATLANLQVEHPNASSQWLAVLSEGFLDQARQLQRELEEYLTRVIDGTAA
jgi:hypothetical protein